jgi:hypothetical protein
MAFWKLSTSQMPPARHKPDPLLAAPKPKKDPLKVSSSTSVDLLTELSLAKEKFDSDRHASSTTAIARGPRPVKVYISPLLLLSLVFDHALNFRKHYGVARIKV